MTTHTEFWDIAAKDPGSLRLGKYVVVPVNDTFILCIERDWVYIDKFPTMQAAISNALYRIESSDWHERNG